MALHVFATNAEADQHNSETLIAVGAPVFKIVAKDSSTDKQTGQLEAKKHVAGKKRTETGGLHEVLEVCVGAGTSVYNSCKLIF